MVEKVKLFLRLSNLSAEDDVTIIADRDVKIRSNTYRVRNSKDLVIPVKPDRTLGRIYQQE